MHRPGHKLAPIARVATAGSLALAAAFASAGVVHAYPAPASTATLSSTCSSVAPGSSCALTFTLVDVSSHPVNGAAVTYAVTGLSTSSLAGGATTNASGVASSSFSVAAAPLLGSSADCGKTATITGTSGAAAAQTQITVVCTAGGGLLGGLFNNVLGSLITNLTGGTLSGVTGGSSYTLTVPAGSLPSGTHISLLNATGSDLSSLTALLSPGESLISAFDIEWPAGVTASSPVTFVIHNAAFHVGDHVYEVVNNALQLYPNSTVSEGVATILFTGDPAFAVVAPTTSVPSGLGNEGAQPAVTVAPASHPTMAYAAVAGGLLVIALLAVPLLRRRRDQV